MFAFLPLFMSFMGVSAWVGLAISLVATMVMMKDQVIEGNRSSDFRVMGSSVGNGIPIVRGRYKIAGNVIWQRGFQEHKSRKKVQDGGWFGSDTYVDEYRYSNIIALALCKNEIAGIKRIWMDGKLIDSVNGKEYDDDLTDPRFLYDFDEKTGKSLDPTGDPLVSVKSPLFLSLRVKNSSLSYKYEYSFFFNNNSKNIKSYHIKNALGEENTPLFKDLSYIVFNFNNLEDFGNRIPKIEVEVIDNSSESEIDIEEVNSSLSENLVINTFNEDPLSPIYNLLYTSNIEQIVNFYYEEGDNDKKQRQVRKLGEPYPIGSINNYKNTLIKSRLKYPFIHNNSLVLSIGSKELVINENVFNENANSYQYELKNINNGFENYDDFTGSYSTSKFGTFDFSITNLYWSSINNNDVVGLRENNGKMIRNEFYNRPGGPIVGGVGGYLSVNDIEVKKEKALLISRSNDDRYSIYIGFGNHKTYVGADGSIVEHNMASNYYFDDMKNEQNEIKPFYKNTIFVKTEINDFIIHDIEGTHPVYYMLSDGQTPFIITFKEDEFKSKGSFYIYKMSIILDEDVKYRAVFNLIKTIKSSGGLYTGNIDSSNGSYTEEVYYYLLRIGGRRICSTLNNFRKNYNILCLDYDRMILTQISEDYNNLYLFNLNTLKLSLSKNLRNSLIPEYGYPSLLSIIYDREHGIFDIKGLYYKEDDISINGISKFNTFNTKMRTVNTDSIMGGVNLAQVVSDMLIESGYSERDFDVSSLQDIDVDGYVYKNDKSIRNQIQLLQSMFQFNLVEEDFKLIAKRRGLTEITEIPFEELSYSNDKGYRISTNIKSDVELNTKVGVRYASLEGGHRESVQYAEYVDDHKKEEIFDTPFVFRDDRAAQISDIFLTNEHREIEKYDFSLSIKYMFLNIGDLISIDGKVLRVVSMDIKEVSIEFSAVSDAASSYFSEAIGAPINKDILDVVDFKVKQRVVVWNGSPLTENLYTINKPIIYTAAIPEDVSSGLGTATGDVIGSEDGESFNTEDLTLMANTSGGFIRTNYSEVKYGFDPTQIKIQFTNDYEPSSITEDEIFSNRKANLIAVINEGVAEYIQFKDVEKVEDEERTYLISNLLRGRFNSHTKDIEEDSVFVIVSQSNYGIREFAKSRIDTETYTAFVKDASSLSENSIQDIVIDGRNIRPFGVVNVEYEKIDGIIDIKYSAVGKINRDWTGDSDDSDVSHLTFFIDFKDNTGVVIYTEQTKDFNVIYDDSVNDEITRVDIKVRDDNTGLFTIDNYRIQF